jgi:hypothetical protein
MAMVRTASARALVLLGATMLLGSCESQLKPSPFVIESFVSSVTDGSGTVAATLRKGRPPSPNGGPTNTVSGFAAAVTGGSAQSTVTGGAPFTRVLVALSGYDDYFELTLPSGSSAPLIIRPSPTLPNMSLPLQYAVGDASTVGAYSSQDLRVIQVGTGDVQVSVSWSDSSDVDLHVVDPSGDEIYYSQRTSPSGGKLDLDSNAACSRNSDHTFKSNENVVWPLGGGAHGTYTVRLDYWSACGVTAPTQYVVTVATAGGTPQTFSGSFTGSGDAGGAGSGRVITTFPF